MHAATIYDAGGDDKLMFFFRGLTSNYFLNFEFIIYESRFINTKSFSMLRFNPSDCVLTQQNENSVHFSNIMTCTKRNHKIIKVVTALYGEYVFIIPGLLPYNDICINGILYNVPSLNNNLTTWRMGCCSGMYVEIFQLVNNDINIDYYTESYY